ncbi:TetR/AcrR family transcriptional regulator [Tersicoccus sp. MR15.9]
MGGESVVESVSAQVRSAVRERVRATAIDLMLEDGFARTTVERIVAATGLPRRSFYRYFGSREDLVLGSTEEQVAVLVAALRSRPADEDPWRALQQAAEALPDAGHAPERSLQVARLVEAAGELRARQLEKHVAWRGALAPVLVERSLSDAVPLDLLSAHALVAAALSCLDVAAEQWMADGGVGRLSDYYDRAVRAVRR